MVFSISRAPSRARHWREKVPSSASTTSMAHGGLEATITCRR